MLQASRNGVKTQVVQSAEEMQLMHEYSNPKTTFAMEDTIIDQMFLVNISHQIKPHSNWTAKDRTDLELPKWNSLFSFVSLP